MITAVLSMVLVIASWLLMHEQRGRALNHGAIANKIAEQLQLQELTVSVGDGVPRSTTAAGLWAKRSNERKIVFPAGFMYAVWRLCIGLFFIADIFIIISAARGYTWFGPGS